MESLGDKFKKADDNMLNRALSDREIEILHMIRPSTWKDWVEEIRRETENNRFSARKLIKNLRNDIYV